MTQKKRTSHSRKSVDVIGIVVKQHVDHAKKLAADLAAFLQKKRKKVMIENENECTREDIVRKSDLIVVLGGDGTFLSVARLMERRSVPLLGINMGQLGFLTEIKKSELFDALTAALKHKLVESERSMLECTVVRKSKQLAKHIMLNDAVISKGSIARIFDLQVLVDEHLVTNIKADGLIVSTPTGSTAYSLAAGGPIVVPHLDAMAITPICPHSLTLRPLVIKDTSEVTVIPQYKSGSVILTLDGQVCVDLRPGDIVKVTKFKKHTLRMLHWAERDYYSLLREKLKYGYRD